MVQSTLDNETVLSDAFRIWSDTKKTISRDPDAFYESRIRTQGFSAMNALLALKNQTESDPYWETADLERLKLALIGYINDRLRVQNSNYDREMTIRDGRSASLDPIPGVQP